MICTRATLLKAPRHSGRQLVLNLADQRWRQCLSISHTFSEPLEALPQGFLILFYAHKWPTYQMQYRYQLKYVKAQCRSREPHNARIHAPVCSSRAAENRSLCSRLLCIHNTAMCQLLCVRYFIFWLHKVKHEISNLK